MKPFRMHHLLRILQAFTSSSSPLDSLLRLYFSKNRAIGSKDRFEISETLYTLVRWKGLIDFLCPAHSSWEEKIAFVRDFQAIHYQTDRSIPLHIRLSFPLSLYTMLVDTYGQEQAEKLCIASNEQASPTIRANRLKTSRDFLYAKWKDTYSLSLCKRAKHGLQFSKRLPFFTWEEFKQGLFEVQDEGSQLLADLVEAKPGDQVLDYCAGSGGKTLAFAPKMHGKGQVYLYDSRQKILAEAKRRLKRAGVQNGQCHPHLPKQLRKKMDWVLVDVPCSGTGTLRRNPDRKWRFSKKTLDDLIREQRAIFQEALLFVKPGGCIVYGTCSLLRQENQDQTNFFLQSYPVTESAPPLITFPTEGGMDGFYGAVFQKR